MKLLLILLPIVVALVAAVATMAIAGMLIPRSHTATRSARLSATPEQVWAILTNFEDAPTWRPGLRKITRLPDRNGRPVWEETSRHGVMPIEIEVFDPPRQLRGRIADPKLPFGGTWTYDVSPENGGARLRITEDGEIYNPVFRYIARTMGYSATLEKYLKALGTKLDQQVTIEA